MDSSSTQLKTQQERLQLLATDLAKLYIIFMEEYSNPFAVTIDAFQALFDESKVEYLHYAGTTTISCPYHDHVVADLLQLAVSYLYVPSTMAKPHARVFGYLLTYFLFATQPAAVASEEQAQSSFVHDTPVKPTCVRIGAYILESALQSIEEQRQQEANKGPASNGVVASRVATRSTLLTSGPSPISKVEEVAILSMHQRGGWQVEPYTDIGAYLKAVMAAHDKLQAPLTRSVSQSHVTAAAWRNKAGPVISSDILQSLGAYEDMKKKVGL